MSSVTASVLVGTNHPNDNSVCPTHHALLYEGSRATWVLHDLTAPQQAIRAPVSAPETVVNDLFGLITRKVLPPDGPTSDWETGNGVSAGLEIPGLALAVTTFGGSLLREHLEQLRGLRITEVTVADQVWQRYRSWWTGEWVVVD